MADNINWDLLDRYFSGECSPLEAEQLAHWVLADPARAAILESVQRIWEWSDVRPDRFNMDAAWSTMQERVAAARTVPTLVHKLWPGKTQQLQATPRRFAPAIRQNITWSSPYNVAVPIAAVLMLAVGVTLWRGYRIDHASADVNMTAPREYTTARGQRSNIQLADGSTVTLSVDSKLRVVYSARTGMRDVYLDGQAFFDVKHDTMRPFRVHTSHGIAEDIGTQFVVKSYATDPGMQVMVAEGMVALHGDTLVRGDLGTLVGQLLTTLHDVPLARYLAFTEGELHFDKVPLSAVIQDLTRWYDVVIQLEDTSLATVPVTASFKQQSAEVALGVVTRSLNAHYTQRGDTVRIFTK